jgi:hypothetical protein
MSFVVGYSRIPRIARLAMILKFSVGRIVSEGRREIARVHCPSFANASFRKSPLSSKVTDLTSTRETSARAALGFQLALGSDRSLNATRLSELIGDLN